jgi:hypothetical protein
MARKMSKEELNALKERMRYGTSVMLLFALVLFNIHYLVNGYINSQQRHQEQQQKLRVACFDFDKITDEVIRYSFFKHDFTRQDENKLVMVIRDELKKMNDFDIVFENSKHFVQKGCIDVTPRMVKAVHDAFMVEAIKRQMEKK